MVASVSYLLRIFYERKCLSSLISLPMFLFFLQGYIFAWYQFGRVGVLSVSFSDFEILINFRDMGY